MKRRRNWISSSFLLAVYERSLESFRTICCRGFMEWWYGKRTLWLFLSILRYSWEKKVLGANSLANQIIEVKKIKKSKILFILIKSLLSITETDLDSRISRLEVFCKTVSWKFHKIHSKTPVPRPEPLLKKRLWYILAIFLRICVL